MDLPLRLSLHLGVRRLQVSVDRIPTFLLVPSKVLSTCFMCMAGLIFFAEIQRSRTFDV